MWIRVQLKEGRDVLFGAMIEQVFFHDFGLKAKDVRVLWINEDADPMCIRVAECLDSGEIFHKASAD